MCRREAYVEKTATDIHIDGYRASDCLVIVTASAAYSQNVYHVFEKGVGEIASYIVYDNDVMDILFVAGSVEEITQEQADAVIRDSSF